MAPINTISQSVKYGLHYAASWPDASFLILRKFLWMILFSVLHWHQYSYVIAHFRSDTLMEIIDNLGTCLAFTLMGVKLVIAWAHHSCTLYTVFSITSDGNSVTVATSVGAAA
ncbi:hypothetical protein WN48_07675 [Eufriesea mexicana]|uniref:Uncharacterized protein n=1 Tax=Eufriesea mexicana TaxID=516756 RepID=A0A310STP8_9HYME|nr:hypothetical protein WN48_07675 [Eufriesea mexicana]